MSSFSDGFMYGLGNASAWALVGLVAFSIALGKAGASRAASRHQSAW